MRDTMNKILYAIIIIFVLAFGFSSSYWVNEPVYTNVTHISGSKNCINCHQNSISQKAWKGIPAWHNKKFSNPILNYENREEHRHEAYRHRNECISCHANNFQAKCANCHTQNEWLK